MLAGRGPVRPQGNDAVQAPVGRTGIEQQRLMIELTGYMRMAATDHIDAAAKTFVQQTVVIVMHGELVAMADEEPDTVEFGFDQAFASYGSLSAVHVACHAQNGSRLRQRDMGKIVDPIAAVDQVVKGLFEFDNPPQPRPVSVAVG